MSEKKTCPVCGKPAERGGLTGRELVQGHNVGCSRAAGQAPVARKAPAKKTATAKRSER